MATGLNKFSLWQHISPIFKGFDGLLALAVGLLACAGLIAMYSSGYDHGTRFVDHVRNMLIAATVMFVVAQIPPQRLMELAVPLYAFGVALVDSGCDFRAHQKRCKTLVKHGCGDSTQ